MNSNTHSYPRDPQSPASSYPRAQVITNQPAQVPGPAQQYPTPYQQPGQSQQYPAPYQQPAGAYGQNQQPAGAYGQNQQPHPGYHTNYPPQQGQYQPQPGQYPPSQPMVDEQKTVPQGPRIEPSAPYEPPPPYVP